MTGSKASGHSGKTALWSVIITEMDETGRGNTTGKSLYPILWVLGLDLEEIIFRLVMLEDLSIMDLMMIYLFSQTVN